jgi:UDP-glucose 4-epimerase
MTHSILITGGFGYIGSRLAQFLSEDKDCEVILGTRQPVKAPDWLPQAKVVNIDWQQKESLRKACKGVDVVIHLAAMNAQDCILNPELALEFNAHGTAKLLHAAITQGVMRFIYLSTAHVYGSPLSGVITEETSLTSTHPYATSHRAAEVIVQAAALSGDIEGFVIRLTNAYGAPVHKDVNCWMLLINDLCRQAVTGPRLVLHSNGLQRRDFIALSDVVRGIALFMKLPIKQCGNGLFNLGGNKSLQVIDVLNTIASRCEAVIGFKPEISRDESGLDNSSPDLDFRIDKMIKLGFKPRADMNQEIDKELEFCKRNFGDRS